jgi:peptidylprolyl isomerase
MIRAEKLDTVTVHYTGELEDGIIFDQSPEDRPLCFILDKEEVIPGFDAAVQGMYQGESKTVTIPCEKAYGEHKEELVETIERSMLPPDVTLKVGSQLEVTRQDGTLFHVMVKDVQEKTVTLDANHPLAGKTLTFKLKLLKVSKESPSLKFPH